MGKEKQISRVFIPLARKKRLLVLLVIITSLVLGLILLGCNGQTVTGPLDETEPLPDVEEVAEEETAVTEEVPDWCDSAGDLYESLPPLGDEAAEGIMVEICIPGGEGYTIEIYDEIPEDLESTNIF